MSGGFFDHHLAGIVNKQFTNWSDADNAIVPAVDDGGDPVTGMSGGGGSVAIEDDGVSVISAASILNFGTGLDVTDDGGGQVTIDAIPASGTGSGVMTRIGQIVVGAGGQATITFASIPGTHENLRVVLMGRGTNATGSVLVQTQFNNDSGASAYEFQKLLANTGTVTGSSTTAAQMDVGRITAASGTAGRAGQVIIDIAGYARTVFDKSVLATATGEVSATHPIWESVGGMWDSTAAITEIDLFCSAGNFAEGTVATLYGIT